MTAHNARADRPAEERLIADTVAGADLIAAERKRQVEAEGWTPEHDDAHDTCGLLDAAGCYLTAGQVGVHAPASDPSVKRALERRGIDPEDDEDFQRSQQNRARHYFGWDSYPEHWPWDSGDWNPSPDPIRNLVKAGALIAAEIDRLQRAAHRDGDGCEGDPHTSPS